MWVGLLFLFSNAITALRMKTLLTLFFHKEKKKAIWSRTLDAAHLGWKIVAGTYLYVGLVKHEIQPF